MQCQTVDIDPGLGSIAKRRGRWTSLLTSIKAVLVVERALDADDDLVCIFGVGLEIGAQEVQRVVVRGTVMNALW